MKEKEIVHLMHQKIVNILKENDRINMKIHIIDANCSNKKQKKKVKNYQKVGGIIMKYKKKKKKKILKDNNK